MAHGSGGVILFGRPKMYAPLGTSCKVADTHGFDLPFIHPGFVRQAKLGGSDRVKVSVRKGITTRR
ncbi:MAG TPA: hypothetical protein DDW65_08655 [Firmicutes bacterium]|jgi:hypothetical protein|nr:hypothetical protein [Bacillota bacterium]